MNEGHVQACPWSGLEPSIMSFCEQRLCGWIVEPANTWSNIGYIIVGVLILRANAGTHRPALSLTGLTAILVGLGSAFFHGTGTRIGEILDLSAMYLISGLFVAFNVRRLLGWSDRWLAILYVVLCGSSMWALVAWQSSGIRLFAVHITIAAVLEILTFRKNTTPTSYRYLGYLCGAFAISYTVWLLDVTKTVCWPDNHVLGGHAIWHLTNSTCLWSFYRYQEQFYSPGQRLQ
ncbi:MAG: hypothetical protein RIQ81_617 [Pseudomonadota bacterium]